MQTQSFSPEQLIAPRRVLPDDPCQNCERWERDGREHAVIGTCRHPSGIASRTLWCHTCPQFSRDAVLL